MNDLQTAELLKERLDEQPPNQVCAIATRSVLRCLTTGIDFQEQRANESVAVLSILRAALTSAVFAQSEGSQHSVSDTILNSAFNYLDDPERDWNKAGLERLKYIADFCLYHCIEIERGTTSKYALMSITDSAALTPNIFQAAISDCSSLLSRSPDELFGRKLWQIDFCPPELVEKNNLVLENTPSSGSVWSFWRNWYEGFLNGEPLDWELQKQVALIPHDVWNSGVEAVATKIDEITKPFDIREQISELEEQLEAIGSASDLPRIGHNNPPERLDIASPDQTIQIIWAELSELKGLTKQGEPSLEGLEQTRRGLQDIAKHIASFSKDVVYDNAKTVATLVVGAGATAIWALIQTKLMLISSTIDEWLAYLILGL